MDAIRDIIEVNGKKIVITLPDSFTAHKAEIIVLPYDDDQSIFESSLVDFFHDSPFFGIDMDITRTDDTGRDVVL